MEILSIVAIDVHQCLNSDGSKVESDQAHNVQVFARSRRNNDALQGKYSFLHNICFIFRLLETFFLNFFISPQEQSIRLYNWNIPRKKFVFKIIKQSSMRGKTRILNNSLTGVNWIRMGIKRAFRSRGLMTFKQRKYISRRRTLHYYLLSGIKLILKVNAKIRLMITRDKSLQ